ncbi:MAG: hypothetical protein RBU23_00460 [Candidatus Auribacterota bacterium]|jgi:prepilin-type processing-associated H-X9-DG protein|nr:hypothetical protein [Candidatus Auribacterota bacterium]
MREYLAIFIVIIFLVVLSETRIRIGVDKFSQISCAGHLKKQYESFHLLMGENPGSFAEHPEKPWYTLLPNINPDNLLCPKTKEVQPADKNNPLICNYALDNKRYEFFKNERIFEANRPRAILLLDSEEDPTSFNIFPMVNPAFRHSNGCNIMLMDGSVIWCDKDDFAGDDFAY